MELLEPSLFPVQKTSLVLEKSYLPNIRENMNLPLFFLFLLKLHFKVLTCDYDKYCDNLR